MSTWREKGIGMGEKGQRGKEGKRARRGVFGSGKMKTMSVVKAIPELGLNLKVRCFPGDTY